MWQSQPVDLNAWEHHCVSKKGFALTDPYAGWPSLNGPARENEEKVQKAVNDLSCLTADLHTAYYTVSWIYILNMYT